MLDKPFIVNPIRLMESLILICYIYNMKSKLDYPKFVISYPKCNMSKGSKMPSDWEGADHKNGTIRLL